MALLETAQRHFLRHGVGTSLEAVAKEAGVGPGTCFAALPATATLDDVVGMNRAAHR